MPAVAQYEVTAAGPATHEAPMTRARSHWLAVAILLATLNIAGGFLVTQRMLRMFRKE